MELIDEIPRESRIALDTNALIYFIEEHAEFGAIVEPVFQAISEGIYTAVVSVVSLLEVLVAPLRAGEVALAAQYRGLLENTQGLTLTPITASLAERAASTRAAHSLRVPDALIAATAVTEGCTHLIANDPVFSRVPQFRTLVVKDFAPS